MLCDDCGENRPLGLQYDVRSIALDGLRRKCKLLMGNVGVNVIGLSFEVLRYSLPFYQLELVIFLSQFDGEGSSYWRHSVMS